MKQIETNRGKINSYSSFSASSEHGGLLAALGLAGAAILGVIIWWILADTHQNSSNELFLFPWVLITAVVVATPSAVLLYQKKFDLFHPLVFAAWSYFVPAFVIGGLVLVFGISEPPFMYLIDNPEYTLPLTFVYIALGFGGLSLGYALPWGRILGQKLSAKVFPVWNWAPADVVLPSVILLAFGVFFFLSAWIAGSIGYQKIDLTDSLSSANYFFSLLMLEASLMLWLFIFKAKNISVFHLISLCLLLLVVLFRVTLAGSKSSLLYIIVLIAMAFAYSGRRLRFKQAASFALIGFLALMIGVIYGNTFRQLRGSEDKTSFNQYISQAEQTLEIITTQDPTNTILTGFAGLAERIEVASSFAVVVANYEKLAPYEAAYGLENNIWTYTWTAFIPRVLWAEKPLVSDARGYSELYFNYGDNSFAMTPMGDLLRNFGPIGVPLGMLLLGFILRIIYAALIENQTATIGRVAMYYMLLTSFTYEGFYGTILPSMIRVAFVAIISLLFVNLMTRRQIRF